MVVDGPHEAGVCAFLDSDIFSFLVNIPLVVCADPGAKEIAAWERIVGADDAPIAAAARAAEVDFLVSGDRHFLDKRSLAAKKGLRVLSPADFLNAIGGLA